MKLTELINQQVKFILVGCDSAKERDGMSELYHVLVKFLNEEPIEIVELSIRGLFLVAVTSNPLTLANEINNIAEKKKFSFISCKKLTPLNYVINSDFDSLSEVLIKELPKVPDDAKWKISINRRHSKIKRNKLIEFVASHPKAPKGKVDLENPDWEIILEVFGKWIGISILPKNSVIVLNQD
jgi:tRNA acetyltransferase TAN1